MPSVDASGNIFSTPLDPNTGLSTMPQPTGNNFNMMANNLWLGQQPGQAGGLQLTAPYPNQSNWQQAAFQYSPSSFTTSPLSPPPLGAGTGGSNVFPMTSPFGMPQVPGQFTPQNSARQPNFSVDPATGFPSGGFPGANSAPRPTSYGDNLLGQIAGNYQQLFSQITNSGGNPFQQGVPTWDAMVAAMQRNTDRKAADLNEYLSVGGNRFSPMFGTAMGDYYNQANLDQNALLAQIMMGSHESAQNRLFGAYGQLAGAGAGAAGQLSSQSFQQAMLEQQHAMAAAQALAGYTAGAGNTLAANSNSAAQTLYGTGVNAANTLAGLQNNAIGNLYSGQLQTLPMWLQNDQTLRSLGLNAGNILSNQWLQQTQLGSQLAQQQYNTQQDIINRTYQEWLRTQPIYNPLLSYMFQGATTYPPQLARQPGFWDYFTGAVGGIAQAVASGASAASGRGGGGGGGSTP